MIEILKRQLGMSGWLSQDMEQTLYDLMDEGVAVLHSYDPAITVDTIKDDHAARALLVEYVRYSLSSARDDWRKNYRTELQGISRRGWLSAETEDESDTDDQL